MLARSIVSNEQRSRSHSLSFIDYYSPWQDSANSKNEWMICEANILLDRGLAVFSKTIICSNDKNNRWILMTLFSCEIIFDRAFRYITACVSSWSKQLTEYKHLVIPRNKHLASLPAREESQVGAHRAASCLRKEKTCHSQYTETISWGTHKEGQPVHERETWR